jgi:hypothetical protein
LHTTFPFYLGQKSLPYIMCLYHAHDAWLIYLPTYLHILLSFYWILFILYPNKFIIKNQGIELEFSFNYINYLTHKCPSYPDYITLNYRPTNIHRVVVHHSVRDGEVAMVYRWVCEGCKLDDSVVMFIYN